MTRTLAALALAGLLVACGGGSGSDVAYCEKAQDVRDTVLASFTEGDLFQQFADNPAAFEATFDTMEAAAQEFAETAPAEVRDDWAAMAEGGPGMVPAQEAIAADLESRCGMEPVQ